MKVVFNDPVYRPLTPKHHDFTQHIQIQQWTSHAQFFEANVEVASFSEKTMEVCAFLRHFYPVLGRFFYLAGNSYDTYDLLQLAAALLKGCFTCQHNCTIFLAPATAFAAGRCKISTAVNFQIQKRRQSLLTNLKKHWWSTSPDLTALAADFQTPP